ncbi:hypothetical protein QM646_00950 [Rhodococcus erythropolis]|nr:hypothetical protein [Rhodococcus erythropolis]
MAYKFVGPQAWREITATVRKKGPRSAAVAFLGSKAPILIPLTRGDVLVCNASDSALRSRSTNPDAIADYLSLGVEVWSSAALHAKVIATSKWAVIGSANASTRSANHAHEAAVITDDAHMLATVVDFIDDMKDEQLTETDLPRLRALWDEGQDADPRFGVPGVNKSTDNLITNPAARFIISDHDDDDVDASAIAKVQRTIRRRHRTVAFAVDFMTIDVPEDEDENDLSIGDVIFWWDDEGLDPPYVVIDAARPLHDDTHRRYQAYRYRKDLDWLSWDELRDRLPAHLWAMLDTDDLHIDARLDDTTKSGSPTKKAALAHALLDLWDLRPRTT